ncbi:hypothetical protein Tco_0580241 [Tanacetum coccineum]
MKHLPNRVHMLQDVKGDGNCGFPSVAVALGLSEDQWPRIQSDLVRELEANDQNYKYIFGTTVVIRLANRGNVEGCTTTFPLWPRPPQSEPHETIVIAHVYGNHYIKVALREGCPLPMTHPLWRTYRSDIAST